VSFAEPPPGAYDNEASYGHEPSYGKNRALVRQPVPAHQYVPGDPAPIRVREHSSGDEVGRYPTREAAEDAVRVMEAEQPGVLFVIE
jgi:hypothetical protein